MKQLTLEISRFITETNKKRKVLFYFFSANSAQLTTKKPKPVITGGNISFGPDRPTKIIAIPKTINKNAEIFKTVLFSIAFCSIGNISNFYGHTPRSTQLLLHFL